MANVQSDFAIAGRIAHIEPLVGLSNKLSPGHTALLIVDMQNDFVADSGMVARSGRDVSAAQKLAGRLPEFIRVARRAGVLIVFIRNIYSTEKNLYLSDAWLEQAARKQSGGYTRYPVCAGDSWEGDYYGEIRPEPGDPVVTKHRYNAFLNTDLDTILRANGIRSLVMTGVATDVCVASTAREAFMRDYYAVMVDDGTATFNQQDHAAALRNFDRYFGEVGTIAEIATVWCKNT